LFYSQLLTNFGAVFDELGIMRLLSSQMRFIAEYVQVMRSVCNALDKLQGERDVTTCCRHCMWRQLSWTSC